METMYLLPLSGLALALALAALGFRARRRRGYAPLAVGSLGAVLLLLGKFVLDSDLAVYAGVAALVGASLWNAWPVRAPSIPSVPGETLYQIGNIAKEK
jgi:hypothetical protein